MRNTKQPSLTQSEREQYEALLAQAEAVASEAMERADAAENTPCHDSLNELQKMVGEWGKQTFPNATTGTIKEHLRREAQELKGAIKYWQETQPHNPEDVWDTIIEEVADIVLLSLHLAHRGGFSLFERIEQKFQACQERQWGEPDAEGVSEHIREEKTDAA